MIMAILITLLAIKIVASNIFGDSVNLIITLCLFKRDAFNWFLLDGDKPKKAISEPDIKPEPISKKIQDKKGVKKW